MARGPLFKSEKEAIAEIERCIKSIDRIRDAGGSRIADPDVCCAFGKSLIHHVYSLCEVILHYVCCEKATIDGTEDWPRLKDLLKKGACVDAPPKVRVASSVMEKIKKDCDKRFVVPEDIEAFFYAADIFLKWAIEVLEEGKAVEAGRYLIDFMGRWNACFRNNSQKSPSEYRLYFLYYIKDADRNKKSDEELNKIYKQRKSEILLPIYILQILEDYPNKNNWPQTDDILKCLAREYNIYSSRRAVEGCVRTLLGVGDLLV